MALRTALILRRLRSSCLEGRTALIQPIVDFLTASKAGTQGRLHRALAPWTPPLLFKSSRIARHG